jgi:hypothetical protein
MENISKLVLGLCGIALITICSASTAAAYCAVVVTGSDSKGSVICTSTGEDANWCYYDCECTGSCDNVYDQLGLIDA